MGGGGGGGGGGGILRTSRVGSEIDPFLARWSRGYPGLNGRVSIGSFFSLGHPSSLLTEFNGPDSSPSSNIQDVPNILIDRGMIKLPLTIQCVYPMLKVYNPQ